MKYALAFLMTTVAAATTFAGTRYCLDAKLTWNSHPSIACPAATEICVTNLDTKAKTAKSLVLLDNGTKTLQLPFSGYDQENDSDVASHLIYSFYDSGVYAGLEVESDKYYPHPTETGTFESLSLSTGKTSSDNSVYSSQQCSYEINKR